MSTSLSQDNEKRVTCKGCLTGNPYLCKSFAGIAPAHAKDFDEWQKQRARDRQRQLDLERQEARVFRRIDQEEPEMPTVFA